MQRPLIIILFLFVSLFLSQGNVFCQESSADLTQKLASAVAAFEEMEYDKATQILQDIIKTHGHLNNPQVAEAHKYLAITYTAVGNNDAAFQEFVKALTINRQIYLEPALASPEMTGLLEKARESLASLDLAAPTIKNVPSKRGVDGEPLEIEAVVQDDIQVGNVVLYYRTAGKDKYKALKMNEIMNDRYVGVIPDNDVTTKGIQYYIEASDTTSRPATTYGTANSPMIISVKKPVKPRGPGMKIGKWSTMGLGAGGVGTGIYYTFSAWETSQLADKKRNEDKDDTARKLDDWADRYYTNSYIAYGVGGALLITSGVLWALDAKADGKTMAGTIRLGGFEFLPTFTKEGGGITTIYQF